MRKDMYHCQRYNKPTAQHCANCINKSKGGCPLYKEAQTAPAGTAVNGCGGKGSWVRPPHGAFFKASCDKHDRGYTKGGDASDRLRCDLVFYAHMCADVRRLVWYKRPYFYTWAYIYLIAVRLFGTQYFNYHLKTT